MTSRRPVRVDTVLGDVLKQHGLDRQIHRWEAVDAWPELVGSHIAAVTRARAVSDDALIVEVETSAWLMELNMMKGELLGRVNERLPDSPLDRIVFVLAETG